MKIEEAVGQRIAQLRDQRGVGQADLGKQLAPLLGKEWTRQAVWAAEHGRRAFAVAELAAFAQVLGVTVDRLLRPPASETELELPSGQKVSRTVLHEVSSPSEASHEALADMGEVIVSIAEWLDKAKDGMGTLAVQLEQAKEKQ